MAGGGGGGAGAMTKSTCLHRPTINIQQTTNDGDHVGEKWRGVQGR